MCVCMDVWMDGKMYVCIYVCVCMYVCRWNRMLKSAAKKAVYINDGGEEKEEKK